MTMPIRRAMLACLAAAFGSSYACTNGPTEPPVPTVASVTVTPGAQTLVSLGETAQLNASPKTATGMDVSGVTLTWSSSAPGVATVDGAGLVTAVANGAATVSAAAGGVSGSVQVTVAQVPASIEAASGDAQAASVGQPLDSAVAVVVVDARDHPVAGVGVTFAVTGGGGSMTPLSGTTGLDGRLVTQWTMGESSGAQEASASLTTTPAIAVALTASAVAGDPIGMELFDGDAQFELVSTALPAPIRVRLLDEFGNGVPDVPVTFSVASDDALDQTEVLTDLDGIASAAWTLGTNLGVYTAQALVADSAVGDIVDLPGSPVDFSATAVAYSVTSAGPMGTVGQTLTIEGMGFAPDPAANVVTVDGVQAAVLAGTQTQLSVVVPSFGCAPAQSRTIQVTRGSSAGSVDVAIDPVSALSLSVGERVVIEDPNAYCLQFLAGGAEDYLVGLTSTRRLNGEMSFALFGYDGVVQPSAPAQLARVAGAPLHQAEMIGAPELALRSWEEDFLAENPVGALSAASLSGPALAVPTVGQTLAMRVPNILGDPCNQFSSISAQVLAVGPRVVIASNASIGPLVQATLMATINLVITLFGDTIWTLVTNLLGIPADVDLNGRITLVFSPAVLNLGVPAFSTVVDQVPRTTCPASNEGEVIYVAVPATVDLLNVVSVAQTISNAPPEITHHLAHIIQRARRLAAGGSPLPAWLGEGQAEMATEVVGMSIGGELPRLDYGAAVMTSEPLWYRPRFDRLSYMFGWNGSTGTVGGAPDRCSLFGFGGLAVACQPQYTPGMAWAFMRYLTDRFGTAFPGGEAAFQQALASADPSQDLVAVLEDLLADDFAEVMVEWAMTLYVDGRVSAGLAPDLQFKSWNLADVYSSLPSAQRLNPATFDFSSFSRAGTVVGGGTSYTLLSTASAHAALALRVRDPADGLLDTAMAPRLWVVRVK